MKDAKEPTTLQEAIIYFSNPEHCREYLIARRWPDGVTCPRCGSKSVAFQSKHNRWQCAKDHDRRQFTLKTGTIFEDSPIGLDKWLAAMWQVVNCKNGISSYEVHRTIGVTQKTAWFMDHRIRFALGMGAVDKLSGEVEADETFIGGKARNMHVNKRQRNMHFRAFFIFFATWMSRHSATITALVSGTGIGLMLPCGGLLENGSR